MVLPPDGQLWNKGGAPWCSDGYQWCCPLALIWGSELLSPECHIPFLLELKGLPSFVCLRIKAGKTMPVHLYLSFNINTHSVRKWTIKCNIDGSFEAL